MDEADQAPHAAGAEEIAARVNPPVQAPAQQAGEIQPAAGAQPVLQANEVRYYYFGSGLNVTLLELFKSLVCWLIFVLIMPVRFVCAAWFFYYFNLMPVRLAAWQNVS